MFPPFSFAQKFIFLVSLDRHYAIVAAAAIVASAIASAVAFVVAAASTFVVATAGIATGIAAGIAAAVAVASEPSANQVDDVLQNR